MVLARRGNEGPGCVWGGRYLPHSRPTNCTAAPVTVIPFPCDTLTVPSQDRVGREQCKLSTLFVVEQYPLLAELLFEHVVLGPKILDHFLSLAIDPADENDEEELPGLKDEVHEQIRGEGSGPPLR